MLAFDYRTEDDGTRTLILYASSCGYCYMDLAPDVDPLWDLADAAIKLLRHRRQSALIWKGKLQWFTFLVTRCGADAAIAVVPDDAETSLIAPCSAFEFAEAVLDLLRPLARRLPRSHSADPREDDRFPLDACRILEGLLEQPRAAHG